MLVESYLFICSIFPTSDVKWLQVVTPAGNVLVDDLTLRVETGSNLLITGNLL